MSINYLRKVDIDKIYEVLEVPKKDWYGAMLHHGASDGDLEGYARYHMFHRRWSDFGYHFGIDPHGDVYISGTDKSRWVHQRNGAHCTDTFSNNTTVGRLPESANKCCIGIVIEGDFYKDCKPTEQQWESLIYLIIKLGLPPHRVYRHDDFTAKAHGCPGHSFDTGILKLALKIMERNGMYGID